MISDNPSPGVKSKNFAYHLVKQVRADIIDKIKNCEYSIGVRDKILKIFCLLCRYCLNLVITNSNSLPAGTDIIAYPNPARETL